MSRPALTFGELMDRLQKHYANNPNLRNLPIYVSSNGDWQIKRVEFTLLNASRAVMLGKPTTENPIAATYVELS